jgi:hypothetical protein
MKIIFNDGTEMECIQVNGMMRNIQGTNRDSLDVVFSPAIYTIADIDTVFSDPNKLTKITLQNNDSIGVYEHYTLRTGLQLAPFVIEGETPTSPATVEQRITVTIAQKTYSEMQQDSLQDTVDMLVLDSLGVM